MNNSHEAKVDSIENPIFQPINNSDGAQIQKFAGMYKIMSLNGLNRVRT